MVSGHDLILLGGVSVRLTGQMHRAGSEVLTCFEIRSLKGCFFNTQMTCHSARLMLGFRRLSVGIWGSHFFSGSLPSGYICFRLAIERLQDRLAGLSLERCDTCKQIALGLLKGQQQPRLNSCLGHVDVRVIFLVEATGRSILVGATSTSTPHSASVFGECVVVPRQNPHRQHSLSIPYVRARTFSRGTG